MSKTKIEWCTHTVNPVTGCEPISEGCQNCYAAGIAKRFWGNRKFSDICYHPNRIDEIRKLPSSAKCFIGSMTDIWHHGVDSGHRRAIYKAMSERPDCIFFLLTKRAENMMKELRDGFIFRAYNLDHVWIGVTCENQERMMERMPLLKEIPGFKKFISFEPLLGSINRLDLHGIDWVIIGQETGIKKRSCDWQWIAGMVYDAKEQGVPVFLKKVPYNLDFSGKDSRMRQFPDFRR